MLKEADGSVISRLPAGCFGTFIFPIAVSEGKQDGVIYADNELSPDVVFVMQQSGFAYLYLSPAFTAYKELLTFFSNEEKLLVYFHVCDAPDQLIGFLNEFPEIGYKIRQRTRLLYPADAVAKPDANTSFTVSDITAENIEEVKKLSKGLISNFWRSDADFLENGFGVVINNEQGPVATCYAASVADNMAEVDVYTLPDQQGKGLGKMATAGFIAAARERNMVPVWDAFTENSSSLNLALKMGFTPSKAYNCLSLYFKNRANESK